ncbi:MAG: hypothetical protein VB141_11670 [Burkholderia gladioli]
MKTLLLDRDVWDLVLDAQGNIALAEQPYSIAQDVASAVRLFIGECWFDTTRGIPYFQQILGQAPNLAFIRSRIERAALTVPEVVFAQCVITAFDGRKLSGQIKVIDTTGVSHNVSF